MKRVPDVQLNLLFIGKLRDKNYNTSFSGYSCKVTKGFMVVGRGIKHFTLYITQAKIVKNVVHAAEFVDEIDLWHKRLCHMSKKGMFSLIRKNALSDVGKANLQKSSRCFVGNQNRVSFKSHLPSKKSVHYDDNSVDMMTKTLLGKSMKHGVIFSDL